MRPWMGTLIRTVAGRFRDADASIERRARGATPETVARQVLMHMLAFGETDGESRVARWSWLCEAVGEALAMDRITIADLIARVPGIDVDPGADRVVLRDTQNKREVP